MVNVASRCAAGRFPWGLAGSPVLCKRGWAALNGPLWSRARSSPVPPEALAALLRTGRASSRGQLRQRQPRPGPCDPPSLAGERGAARPAPAAALLPLRLALPCLHGQPAGSAQPPDGAAAATVAPLSASLGQELSQAMKRMAMGVEQEYAWDIFRSLMEQPRFSFQASDLPHALTAEGRALLVDWLVKVHEYLKLADDTLYLAVYLMNAYLKMSKVRVATLQLLSVTCLFLACKVEETSCPQPSQLCFMTEGTVSPKELFCMERKILARLQFGLHYANPVPLLHLLAAVGRASPEERKGLWEGAGPVVESASWFHGRLGWAAFPPCMLTVAPGTLPTWGGGWLRGGEGGCAGRPLASLSH
ncbi:cyclin-P [Heteronotia binoei]|uniref:cyclin-P n=1 Tax=Heteronotia binoei TaxID=13085 RepID=UPI00292F6C60|nr:cyclin-P [Heteronotia binoei]